MKIVVLDGFTLNSGDLDWSPLRALGECEIYVRSPAGEVARRVRGAEILLTNKTVLDRELILHLDAARYIGVLATGYDVVDLPAARARRIVVTNVPAYSTPSVVQLTFALLFELTHRVGRHAEGVRAGRWATSPDFSYSEVPLVEVAGLTLGLVGFGRIAQSVARVGQALGMKVIVHTRTPPKPAPAEIEWVSLDRLFQDSDVISLHCPLNDQTRRLVNAETLARMKPAAFLINTARGALVDEPALAAALATGRIAGAGLDVLEAEPPAADHPLTSLPQCVVTPHLGWATRAARERLLRTAIDNVRAFLDGRPQNVVN